MSYDAFDRGLFHEIADEVDDLADIISDDVVPVEPDLLEDPE